MNMNCAWCSAVATHLLTSDTTEFVVPTFELFRGLRELSGLDG